MKMRTFNVIMFFLVGADVGIIAALYKHRCQTCKGIIYCRCNYLTNYQIKN